LKVCKHTFSASSHTIFRGALSAQRCFFIGGEFSLVGSVLESDEEDRGDPRVASDRMSETADHKRPGFRPLAASIPSSTVASSVGEIRRSRAR
jgi:hypothetical protein